MGFIMNPCGGFLIMPRFTTKQDLYDRFGVENVNAWSDLNGGQTDNDDRINAALDNGEYWVENQLGRSRYQTPMSFTGSPKDPMVIDWIIIKAGDWLYTSRSLRRGSRTDEDNNRPPQMLKQVKIEIAEVLAGKFTVNMTLRKNPRPTGPTCV